MIGVSARFCLECGTALREQTVDGTARAVCPQCGYIHFRDPKLVAVALITRGDQVLLVQRDIEPGRGLWSLPGGYVDWDEHPEAAAVRECAEEIRAQVALRGLFRIVQVVTPARVGIVIMAYRGDIVDGQPEVGHEVQQVAYFPLHQLPPLAFESHGRLLGELALQNAS
jgi:ADP-ribose pyrophosphatase YjhB (NUDIX family)